MIRWDPAALITHGFARLAALLPFSCRRLARCGWPGLVEPFPILETPRFPPETCPEPDLSPCQRREYLFNLTSWGDGVPSASLSLVCPRWSPCLTSPLGEISLRVVADVPPCVDMVQTTGSSFFLLRRRRWGLWQRCHPRRNQCCPERSLSPCPR